MRWKIIVVNSAILVIVGLLSFVLVKASRSAALEGVVTQLDERLRTASPMGDATS